jgi:hypothetical protein
MSGVTTNISLSVLCDQRKKQMLFNNPQTRYTPVSPYNSNYTKFQLDMRRKAEILKYNNTTSSTKTNNLTKAQKFAQLINGKITKTQGFQNKTITVLDQSGKYTTITVGYPDKLITTSVLQTTPNAVKIVGYKGYFTISIIPNGLLVNCAKDRLIPTPTSSCGISGPIINLIDDETVPLYNFTNNTINNAAYSESQNEKGNPYELRTNSNVVLSTNNFSNLGSMLITPFIADPIYNYTLKIPFGLYASNTSGRSGSAILYIDTVSFVVKYSNSTVSQNATVNLLTHSLNSGIRVNYIELSESVNGYNYFAYLDTFVVSNLLLSTNAGYVYDFFLELNINSNNTRYDFANTKIIANYNNSTLTSVLSISS